MLPAPPRRLCRAYRTATPQRHGDSAGHCPGAQLPDVDTFGRESQGRLDPDHGLNRSSREGEQLVFAPKTGGDLGVTHQKPENKKSADRPKKSWPAPYFVVGDTGLEPMTSSV